MKISWRVEDEWLEWYHLTPADRWRESQKLWEFYLSSGGTLNSEPDSQSPFDPLYSEGESTFNGGSGLRAIRRYWMPLFQELEELRHQGYNAEQEV